MLGISTLYHDTGAAIVVDGDIVAAAQEERFSRKKYDAVFPTYAINYCLKEGVLKPGPLSYVAFCDKPLTKFERLLATDLRYVPRAFRSFATAMPVSLKRKLHLRLPSCRHLNDAEKARLAFLAPFIYALF